MEVVSLMEGEWSCYRSNHFNGGRMVMLQKWSLERRWPVSRRENGCYRGGQRENSHVTEVVSLMEGKWPCYTGGQFNGI